ncbi:helix-turn-helix domain-containing protein [Ramlibacter albus]|uniref:Helix-turn-helix transcriptional regulator n=1 Tax=Ramlibacter albus TaxID=2079448 RepID=A0A923M7Z8_9BURK|nr:helix-turn-helix transcriptional regulator [Ramlibacter albus]MBC5765942.1 helix-turn-helix transcriptional regulator [Ramlibacter albus]
MSNIIRTPADLGAAIRQLRIDRDITAVELADRSGRSRDLLWRLESGRDVSSSALFDVLRALGVTLEITPATLPTLEEIRERFKDPE